MSAVARRRLPSNVDPRTGRIRTHGRTTRLGPARGALHINGELVAELDFTESEFRMSLDPANTYAKQPLPSRVFHFAATTGPVPVPPELTAMVEEDEP